MSKFFIFGRAIDHLETPWHRSNYLQNTACTFSARREHGNGMGQCAAEAALVQEVARSAPEVKAAHLRKA